jgi:very-short-patch-repair endonuclease
VFKFLNNIDYTATKFANLGTVAGAPPAMPMPLPLSMARASSGLAKSSASWAGISHRAQANVIFTQPQFYSPLHTPQQWQTPQKRREIYQYCRHFVDNEPKVAAALDFYSAFPMNGFTLQCKDFQVKRYYDHFNKKVRMNYWSKMFSREYYTLGDVFPFAEIQCPQCHGSGVYDGEQCFHPGGTFGRMVALNPDWIEVQKSVLADDPVITLLPDDELKRLVWLKQPKELYDKLPAHIRQLILSGRPIPLAQESISHIRFNPYAYGVYGTSLLRRLFKVLMYKDKLMTAQWIVAERLILPIRVVKVGDNDRPANGSDIADVQQQLAQVANDPNLTLVTHHAFDYDWIGTNGKVLQLSNEYDLINKEILQGLMINEALLSGEMVGYQSAAIGAEALIERMESWRNELAEWIEDRIYKPIAQMRGFIDEEESKDVGEPVWIIPKIKWNDLHLRDETQAKQMLMQLHDKLVLSTQTLCEKMDLNYDQEVERLRMESAQGIGPSAQQGAGGGGGDMSGMGGAMGGGGGAPGALGGPGGDMGAAMGGGGMDMGGGLGAPPGGGGAPMGAPPMGGGGGLGAPTAASSIGGTSGKVLSHGRKSKAQDSLDEAEVQPRHVKLTSIEINMRKILQGMNIPFRHFIQPKLGRYNADFTIPDLKLDIECDGGIWHGSAEAQAHDKERDANLAKQGWTVVRFSEKELKEKIPQVQATLDAVIKKLWQRAWEQQSKTASVEAAADTPPTAGYLVDVNGCSFSQSAWIRAQAVGYKHDDEFGVRYSAAEGQTLTAETVESEGTEDSGQAD